MIDTVWKIGDTVYGVHSEVFNSTYYIYIVEEKIVYIIKEFVQVLNVNA